MANKTNKTDYSVTSIETPRTIVQKWLYEIGSKIGKNISLNSEGVSVFTYEQFTIVIEVPSNLGSFFIYTNFEAVRFGISEDAYEKILSLNQLSGDPLICLSLGPSEEKMQKEDVFASLMGRVSESDVRKFRWILDAFLERILLVGEVLTDRSLTMLPKVPSVSSEDEKTFTGLLTEHLRELNRAFGLQLSVQNGSVAFTYEHLTIFIESAGATTMYFWVVLWSGDTEGEIPKETLKRALRLNYLQQDTRGGLISLQSKAGRRPDLSYSYSDTMSVPTAQFRNMLENFIDQALNLYKDVRIENPDILPQHHQISNEKNEKRSDVVDAAPQTTQNLHGHSSVVRCCADLGIGNRVLSGSSDMSLKVWDLGTGKCLKTFQGHSDTVRCCAVLEKGFKVLSGSSDTSLKVWDVATGKCLQTLWGHSQGVLCCAALNGDNQVLSGGVDKTLKVWDVGNGECLKTLKGHSHVVLCCDIVDGDRVLSGSSDATLRVWDVGTGECLQMFKDFGEVLCCAVLDGGGKVVSGSTDRTLRVWDVGSGTCLQTLRGHSGEVQCCAVWGDGEKLLSGSTELKVWEAGSGKCLQTLQGHSGAVGCCAVLGDGDKVLIGGFDKTLEVWELQYVLPPHSPISDSTVQTQAKNEMYGPNSTGTLFDAAYHIN